MRKCHHTHMAKALVNPTVLIPLYRAGRVIDTYSGYMAKDDLEKVLVEATANENWNISNSKLLQISDATYNT